MTQQEWLEGDDPVRMMAYLHAAGHPKIGARKKTLFAAAALRCDPDHIFDVAGLHRGAAPLYKGMLLIRLRWADCHGDSDSVPCETAGSADILRDIVGNPFQPRTGLCGRIWAPPSPGAPHQGCRDCAVILTSTVRQIATAVHGDRSFEDLPVLADAMEEAGRPSGHLLAHLRSPGPHYLGCWALDLIVEAGK